MAKSDVLVRMKADTSSYDANIAKASKTLDNFVQSNLTMGGVLKNGVTSLTKFAGGFSALSAVMKVAKDAFMSSEETVDAWGRVVDQAKSLYEGFLTALNTGDISGYLSRIDSIMQAARAAYNELDRLGTMKTIQAPQMSAQQTENERMRMMIQTGRYIAPVDGRRASMQNGQLLTPEQIKRIEQQLQGGMEKVVTLVGNEVAQTGRAIDAVYNRQAQELGMSLKEFRKGTSSMAEFDKRMAGYEQYQKWRAEHTTIDMQSGREIVARGNPFGRFAKWGTFRVDGDRYNDLVKLIQQRDQQAGSLYGMQSQAYRTMNRAEGLTLRRLMGGAGGASGGGKSGNAVTYAADSIAAQERLVSELTKKWKEAGSAVRNDYAVQLGYAQQQLEMMTGKGFDASRMREIQGAANIGPSMKLNGGIKEIDTSPLGALENQLKSLTEAQEKFGRQSSEVWQRYQMQIDDTQVKIDKFKGVNVNGANASGMSWEQAASAISSVGSALQQIPDPGAKILGIIGEALANIASGFAQASSKEGKGGVWYWIAATAAGLATMVSTIAAIHSATGYASGGVIPGNRFSGDNQWARVNAGELILNQAEAGVVASALQSEGIGGMHMEAYIDAEQLRVMMVRNSTRRHGRRSGYEYSRMM